MHVEWRLTLAHDFRKSKNDTMYHVAYHVNTMQWLMLEQLVW